MVYDIGVMGQLVHQAKQEAWLMALRQELGRLLEQYQREETDAKEVMARAEHRLETIARQRPKVLALLEELSTDEDVPTCDLAPGRLTDPGTGDEPVALQRHENPFPVSSMGYEDLEALRRAGTPLHVKEIQQMVSQVVGRKVAEASIRTPLKVHPDVFVQVAPNTYALVPSYA